MSQGTKPIREFPYLDQIAGGVVYHADQCNFILAKQSADSYAKDPSEHVRAVVSLTDHNPWTGNLDGTIYTMDATRDAEVRASHDWRLEGKGDLGYYTIRPYPVGFRLFDWVRPIPLMPKEWTSPVHTHEAYCIDYEPTEGVVFAKGTLTGNVFTADNPHFELQSGDSSSSVAIVKDGVVYAAMTAYALRGRSVIGHLLHTANEDLADRKPVMDVWGEPPAEVPAEAPAEDSWEAKYKAAQVEITQLRQEMMLEQVKAERSRNHFIAIQRILDEAL